MTSEALRKILVAGAAAAALSVIACRKREAREEVPGGLHGEGWGGSTPKHVDPG